MSGGGLYDLKAVLGHAEMKTTERYAHLSNEHLARVRDIIKPNIESYADVIEASDIAARIHSRSNHAPTENSEAANF